MPITAEALEKADEIRQAAEQRYAALRSNPLLRPEAVQANMARTYLQAKSQLDQLRGDDQQTLKSRTQELRTTAFGIDDLARTPADRAALAISSRDAQDRAAALDDPREAQALLARAIDSGDDLLTRAIGQRAFDTAHDQVADAAWYDVVNEYAGTRPPEVSQALSELVTLTRQRRSAVDLFGLSISPPLELASMPEYRIAVLADGDMPDAS